jgi:uncharacterized protein YkwD
MGKRLFFLLVVAIWVGGTAVLNAQQTPDSPAGELQPRAYLPLVLGGEAEPTKPQPGDCLTAEENELANLINNYRNDNGLPDVPVAKSMVMVAQWHVLDLETNNPDSGTDPNSGLECNLHSWSEWQPDLWSPVCYVSSHIYASGMWDKPREITDNLYTGNGFENGYWHGGQATAQGAFDGWRNSPAHNAVILEQGVWAGYNWPAMGVGLYEHYAVLWFGDAADPQGTVSECAP